MDPDPGTTGHEMRGAPQPPLDCRLEERPGATIVHVRGEADLDSHGILDDALTGAVDLHKPVILELKNLRYIDAYGIVLLLRHQRRASAGALRVIIANPSRIVRRVVDVLELDRVLPVFASIEAALQVVDERG